MQFIALVLGLVLYVPAFLAGVLAFLSPLRSKAESGRKVRLTTVDALPSDGTPQRIPVIADRYDGWTHYPAGPIGAVFLRRMAGNAVEAFQVLCPHLGCSVEYRAAEKIFFCPCHRASFDASGKRREQPSMSPRDLDTLDVEIRNGEVWVDYRKFRTGSSKKTAEA